MSNNYENNYENFLTAYAAKEDIPVWFKALLKTLSSKNITIEDWNIAVQQTRNVAAEAKSIYKWIKAFNETGFIVSIQGDKEGSPIHQGIVQLSLDTDFGITLTAAEINSLPSDLQDTIAGINTDISESLATKVDKVTGERLISAAEQTKLANIEAGAQVNTVLGVKGAKEVAFRKDNINLTPANIGAATPEYVDAARNAAVDESFTYTTEVLTTAKEYTDDETERAIDAETALSARIQAQEGLGGMLSAHDFGKETPTQQELTDYALIQIPSINNDATEIWNGTKVSNLFDGRTWQLTNTPNTVPAIFEWVNIGATFMAKATDDTLGVGKGSSTVKVNSGGEFYTSTNLIGAATKGQFEVLDTQVSKAVTDVKNAIANMEATLGLAPLWDAEGENELLDAEGENLLCVAHIDANSINGREFYVMTKAEHAALIQAGTYVPDAFYLTF